jgi:hypothetical protein
MNKSLSLGNSIGMIGLIVGVFSKLLGFAIYPSVIIIISFVLLSLINLLSKNQKLLSKSIISILYIASIFPFFPLWPGAKFMLVIFTFSPILLACYMIIYYEKIKLTTFQTNKDLITNFLIILGMVFLSRCF